VAYAEHRVRAAPAALKLLRPSVDLRSLAMQGIMTSEELSLAGQAKSLSHWHDNTHCCGRCGGVAKLKEAQPQMLIVTGFYQNCPNWDFSWNDVFYRDMAIQAIEMDPSAVVMAMHRQILNFAMPGAGIPGFREKAKAMANAGVYNLRIHLEQVLRPVLDKHFRLAEIQGLSDQAKQAREEIYAHLERLKRVAGKLGEPLGPVKGDLSNDPIGVA